MNKIVTIISVIIIGFVLTGFVTKKRQQPNPKFILEFIKNNPDKAAITVIRNDSVLININENRLQPLASTVKIIIAIEYAHQAANKTIDVNQLIDLSQLNKYYIPNTDGNAHNNWLKYIENKINDNKISVKEIAKGMIMFSSNANTEWLQQKLGLNNINTQLQKLNLDNHTPIYYMVSSLFVGKEVSKNLNNQSLQQALKTVSESDYIALTNKIHQKLNTDVNYKNDVGDLSMPIQKIWSDNLQASTTKAYATLMQKLNNKRTFSAKIHQYLDPIMESMMQSKGNQINLKHAGFKGGSTAFVLTQAFYATDKKGNTTELAMFFNNLTNLEFQNLSLQLNNFLIATLYNKDFRKDLLNNN
ncbi:serine hydrolase [uncultured Olleya sp.]|uniref:serine hydrolase n=1 Tax=uncultured Olleya sp. TaxID=757243 RepID=UPI002593F46D|nr:serine hydrolase [uncultured Olleya sp.]